MKILLVGGGSGGHVTPLSAVAKELQKRDPKCQISIVTNKQFLPETKSIFSSNPEVSIVSIYAGKYRRYHGKSVMWHILHLPTLLGNIRDVLYVLIGMLQSFREILGSRPDVIFCKGGYVCIPVGVVARLMNKPLVIHDSDTRPGLTNKILSRWAVIIATGMPISFYPYSKSKMRYIGMPVSEKFMPITKRRQAELKEKLGFEQDQKLLLVTGGGNGAQSLNKLVCEFAKNLLEEGWGIIHATGRGKLEAVAEVRGELDKSLQTSWLVGEFIDMSNCMLAADIIMARTSASTLQEAANARKVVIGIPSPHLMDQKMNAEYFESEEALIHIDESKADFKQLQKAILELAADSKKSSRLSENIYKKFSKPESAKQLADIIVSTIPDGKNK